MPAVQLRALDDATWPRAMRLCARAFCDYGYVRATFGEDPLERFAGTTLEFGSRPWDAELLTVGAWAGGTLVGMACAEPPGRCHVCDPSPSPSPEPEGLLANERLAEATRRFEQARRLAHAPVPPHAHVASVAVEPVVHGTGVGTTVTSAILDLVRAAGGGPLLLECIFPLEGFYARLGFRQIDRFEEPGSEDVLLLRTDL